ncbi:dihydrolipoyllysine-residue acetyltransferase [Pandoraea apista]|uniref:Acetyltransferase component of pyruvate dehydrogenase complex n=1 Tax=Pandoraea apista TaxID=93218 RepID=A0ABX9ZVR7_9BURK|nr:dihydrolipoyllysine-residue acetyltransferase [Pandoraea apista]ALS63993.1 dihydrolipoyllysine-residue acetyltransferase [Pandoraea apista]PTE03054.1 dihydrolipoyllysine-residue acetyltransferase [Pandoraea apista]RRJ35204.1 dihydrolipoyllysine-residue acetyltransferase [Pandoraea apista]RRJ81554.1 dihydrolipoyllysine-residue acetyltransferase [Pandoraea apista]RRW98695.1 dihydrolipoyllysine-residue acetyltransferase [Pandoraea apista]
MSQVIEVKVPDIGDFKDLPVIDVLVKAGDKIDAEQALITLESDKATMDVPSPAAGTIKALSLKVGDEVSEGSLILTLETANGSGAQANGAAAPAPAAAPQAAAPAPAPAAAPAAPAASGSTSKIDVKVPDIGGYDDVPVIDVLVKVGDTVTAEQSLVTLESDKASMDVPSPAAGVVKELKVKVGDKVSEGTLIVVLEGAAPAKAAAPAAAPASAPAAQSAAPVAPAPVAAPAPAAAPAASAAVSNAGTQPISHASPSVRKFARELGVDVTQVKGTGPKGRVVVDDVRNFIKSALAGNRPATAGAAPAGGGELNLLPWPKVDFSKFGPVEPKALSRIKKISGANLHRNWVMIPHVTNNDEADIGELEAFRVQLNKENEKAGVKVTMLAFVIKACVLALKKFPTFNASLDGDNLVFKQYFHIGFAADTPNGLVVPVVRDADKKGVFEIARETSELAKLAREGKLKPDQMQGGCFSISSLGGIGGTTFTPIINAPEVAILGLSRSYQKPVWDERKQQFLPQLTLPLSLSYDHRVIDGAEAARFNAYLGQLLQDFRRAML